MKQRTEKNSKHVLQYITSNTYKTFKPERHCILQKVHTMSFHEPKPTNTTRVNSVKWHLGESRIALHCAVTISEVTTLQQEINHGPDFRKIFR